ncbi:RagB/SusD family nutrient uptake outer membrane protein [Marinifilum sp.]|uniref:RagB/SusD family nutrient uptake outer membrane protein n=1 Tax=Marinifilum sp. TaxID=2033137 RepID=UPI003BAD796A
MKIKIYLLVLIIIFTSCEDYLEVEPKNKISMLTYEDAWQLMGAHLRTYFDNESLGGTTDALTSRSIDPYLVFNYYSDDLNVDTYLLYSWQARNNDGMFYKSLNWFQGTIHSKLWRNHYKNIGFYNTILDHLQKVKETVSEDEIIVVKAEAQYLLAYELFKLIQYFSPYDNDDLGLPINLDPLAISTYDSSRKTQTEVYQIITDLLEEILTYKTTPQDYSVFYNKNIVNGLLAKVYHFKGGSGAGSEDDYSKAINYAKEAMKGRSLTSIDNFSDLFKFGYGDEKGILTDKNYALIVSVPSWYTNGGIQNIIGRPMRNLNIHVSDELLNLYSPDDVRLGAFVEPDGRIFKFSELDRYYEDNAHYFLRVAEMQLIIAESYARIDDLGNARLYLEEFQSNRINDYTGFEGSDVLGEILNERRREFCFEYDMRWTDLVRLQTGWTRNAVDKDEEGITYTIEDNDYRFTQPIPQEEELMFNNKIKQNPGWSLL